ncbi:MAG: aspartyl protease family protein, partial [Candidatus Thiodiazotropha taylori]|nr:aspartyl protease family protein [Candidatus Thiodiazotropha taylori]MCW4334351.1 RNase H-like domain-containing protein [Candidatus Thiodiazotropha endolucinida]
EGKGVADPDQKKALLLHCGGMDAQDIYYTLPEGQGEDAYEKAKDSLNTYFNPLSNVPFERHQFRTTVQNEGESIEQYIVRLKQKAETCEFGTENDVNIQIRDQIVEKCRKHELRRKLLEKGRTLTLQQVRDISRAFEDSEKQASTIEGAVQEINKLSINRGAKPKQKWVNKKKIICYSCGLEGHMRKDPKCPAKGKQCRKCKQYNHFQKMCKTKTFKDKKNERKNDTSRMKVRQLEENESDNSDYTFIVSNDNDRDNAKIMVEVGGISLNVMIDSGASCNIIDRETWEKLKQMKIKCSTSRETRKIYAYGSKEPLQVAGTFWTNVTLGDKMLENVEFIVLEGQGKPLLGRDTSLKLDVLKLGPFDLNSISSSPMTKEQIIHKYSKCFEGFGKLKDFQLEIPIDSNIDPVIQNVRRVPFNLREKLGNKLDELEKMDIIEKVNEPSKWVSPVVVVPKPGGDIRLCVDMRQANQAVKRVRHFIPTIDELLQDMNESKVFSKIDIQMAYHQIELKPESREITTFITHKGLYRYKRLNFGISCAVEMFQKVVQQLLQGCEGVNNILDDIIVHAPNQQEHDKRLEKVLSVLQEKGITLNRKKCEFNMPKLEFMGHVLSESGVGPSEAKVSAVLNAREPRSISEVRSWLGLVQYNARFIPDLATISAPLRELTHKNAIFKWGQAEQNSFDRLKKCLASAGTLAYYDKNAQTQVIADASPVGLGAVLTQKQGDDYRVISYASRSLTDTEKRYSQTEKEALSLVWACERFHVYLYGTNFELLTDHKPLETIFAPRSRSKSCARIERWVLRLQSYKFTVRYIKGRKNIADTLSRLLSKTEEQEPNLSKSVESDDYVKFVARESTPVAMTTREIERASDQDSELVAVRECLLNGKWYQLPYKEYLPVRSELSAIGKLILRGTRIVIPRSLREQVLTLGHD